MVRRKGLVTALTACVLVGGITSPSADASAGRRRHARHVQDDYAVPAQVVEVLGYGVFICSHGGSIGNLGCVSFPVKPTEKFLELEIADASGLPAPAWVSQEDFSLLSEPVCGKTDAPIKITPGVAVEVWLFPYSLVPLCPGVSTTGTVKATLSNIP